MAKKKKTLKNHWEDAPDFIKLKKRLSYLRDNRQKIISDTNLYFHEKKNQHEIVYYYQSVRDGSSDGSDLFNRYHQLISRTHIEQLPYFVSKDLYLYTWVDLHPDGTVKSIYSGDKRNPEDLIHEDFEIIKERYQGFQEFLRKIKQNEFESFRELKAFERALKLNTEHIVPQSWFGAVEPMKGDLHHLFVCEPACNIARSNFPYDDFTFYQPETPNEPIQNLCGVAVYGRFEPENGKGIVARSMLYFILRYPKAIKKSFRTQINIPLLIRWHKEFPVSLYEKHRNQTIYQIQGNRNPFIDYPELVEKLEFPDYSC
ncbi:endonuclease I family protein [Bacillus sp. JJ1764]|uniref:endonuclease I family protein n=1 Tax=Bacillus sp. JJ1764 TaxID=3122964 RepID=UPI0030001711